MAYLPNDSFPQIFRKNWLLFPTVAILIVFPPVTFGREHLVEYQIWENFTNTPSQERKIFLYTPHEFFFEKHHSNKRKTPSQTPLQQEKNTSPTDKILNTPLPEKILVTPLPQAKILLTPKAPPVGGVFSGRGVFLPHPHEKVQKTPPPSHARGLCRPLYSVHYFSCFDSKFNCICTHKLFIMNFGWIPTQATCELCKH